MSRANIACASAALAALAFALQGCALFYEPPDERERRLAYMAQVDHNPPEFQALCDARAGARLTRAVPAGGIALAVFDWPEDQDLLFLWGASFLEITDPQARTTYVGSVTAPADVSTPYRVRLAPDGDPRCKAGNADRDEAVRSGELRRNDPQWERALIQSGRLGIYLAAPHQAEAAYYRGQCLVVVDETDDAAFHAPARFELVRPPYPWSPRTPHPPFRAGAFDLRTLENSRRLVDRETNEVLAEEEAFGLWSVDLFWGGSSGDIPIGLNHCDGAERGRPTDWYALRPFATPARQ